MSKFNRCYALIFLSLGIHGPEPLMNDQQGIVEDASYFIGRNPPHLVETLTGPNRALGLVKSGGELCAGFVAHSASRRMVGTACHCIYDDNGRARGPISFTLGSGYPGESHYSAQLGENGAQIHSTVREQAQCWSFLVLDEPVPKSIQPLSLVSAEIYEMRRAPFKDKLRVAGYPVGNGGKLLEDTDCTVTDESFGSFLTTCGTFPGFSGGPVMVQLPDKSWGVVGIVEALGPCIKIDYNDFHFQKSVPYQECTANRVVPTQTFIRRALDLDKRI